ncbi:MAG: phosphatase PAP2 family protein [Saprospiraceae bacterium]
MDKTLFFICLINLSFPLFGQVDTINITSETTNHRFNKFSVKDYILPSVLIGYGLIAIENDYLKLINVEIRNELQENIDRRLTVDDYAQFVPALSVYSLNLFGIKSKNDIEKRSIILGTSTLVMVGTVRTLKSLTKVERPDKSSKNSFPSGHTATAFAGAEFLWHEYRDVSHWYGITGYAIAIGTGFFRIYNARHWLSDVAMGAGIGILSTKCAYLIQPYISRKLFDKRSHIQVMLSPTLQNNILGMGLNLGITF